MLWAAEVMPIGSQRLGESVASALGAVAAADVNEFGSVFVGCARRTFGNAVGTEHRSRFTEIVHSKPLVVPAVWSKSTNDHKHAKLAATNAPVGSLAAPCSDR